MINKESMIEFILDELREELEQCQYQDVFRIFAEDNLIEGITVVQECRNHL